MTRARSVRTVKITASSRSALLRPNTRYRRSRSECFASSASSTGLIEKHLFRFVPTHAMARPILLGVSAIPVETNEPGRKRGEVRHP